MSISWRELQVIRLGRMSYSDAWRLQKRLHAARVEGDIPDTLLLLEHPPVITLGKGAHREHVLFPEAVLRKMGVELYEVERGGDVTYHGPGQLVGYPIVHLREGLAGIRPFVEGLENMGMAVLRVYGVVSHRDPRHRGVWVGRDKVMAVGVAVRRWVTFHGFALNVDPDLSHFSWIVPCGIADRGVTSIARLIGRPVSLEEVMPHVIQAFVAQFGYDHWYEKEERDVSFVS
ncbi:MAG: lipoyl(octanoyl) transferase LipB [Candidatus Hydrothermae bacterium]|nr:lipoyl(octanoyl) transferase LipB [Candidatus Hydrothermae bacterium]